ncbi:thioesterase II family protein [Streptomyces yaizuensis]|uniref:Alpha/beta fold hydrolase n=1 Tax=Streptomyces yaizuensis TaxID=2989713 RepID=A0ABQ5NRL8_9ACTN|nr:thioesterase domain-containing protein [Streptomyces sp. YSPA8]GLF93018.1 alpha/beta fold hydrolase [Streptomyces sp. YSPA8]
MTSVLGEGARPHERIARLPDDQRARLVRRLRGRTDGAGDTDRWFVRHPSTEAPRLRLFCFPYAGGGGSAFREWSGCLPAGVELWAAQLPGRESRVAEPALRRMDPLVEALYEAVLPRLELPYAFFGHSMGALVAFELTRLLRRRGAPLPTRLLLGAFRAPQLPNPHIRIHHLPDEVLKTVLRKEGTPRQVLESDELMRALLPTLRADLELCDTYQHREEQPLAVPLSVFGGHQDVRVGRGDLDSWRTQTAKTFRLVMLPGSHFFLHSSQDLLLAELSRELGPTPRTTEGEGRHD